MPFCAPEDSNAFALIVIGLPSGPCTVTILPKIFQCCYSAFILIINMTNEFTSKILLMLRVQILDAFDLVRH